MSRWSLAPSGKDAGRKVCRWHIDDRGRRQTVISGRLVVRSWGRALIVNRRPKLEIIAPAAASPEEAAAVVAALEQFMRDTAPTPAPLPTDARSPWAVAALLEATGHPPGQGAAWGRRTNGGLP